MALPLSLTPSSVSANASTWPLDKYSYSNPSNPSTSEVEWSHFPHRDSLYLVFNKPSNDSPLASAKITLKIVWNIQILEEVNLGELMKQQIVPDTAIVVLGRPPMLAIKYTLPKEQLVRRLQVRFKFSSDFEAAKTLFEQCGCSVKLRPAASGSSGDSQQKQQQMVPNMSQGPYPPNSMQPEHHERDQQMQQLQSQPQPQQVMPNMSQVHHERDKHMQQQLQLQPQQARPNVSQIAYLQDRIHSVHHGLNQRIQQTQPQLQLPMPNISQTAYPSDRMQSGRDQQMQKQQSQPRPLQLANMSQTACPPDRIQSQSHGRVQQVQQVLQQQPQSQPHHVTSHPAYPSDRMHNWRDQQMHRQQPQSQMQQPMSNMSQMHQGRDQQMQQQQTQPGPPQLTNISRVAYLSDRMQSAHHGRVPKREPMSQGGFVESSTIGYRGSTYSPYIGETPQYPQQQHHQYRQLQQLHQRSDPQLPPSQDRSLPLPRPGVYRPQTPLPAPPGYSLAASNQAPPTTSLDSPSGYSLPSPHQASPKPSTSYKPPYIIPILRELEDDDLPPPRSPIKFETSKKSKESASQKPSAQPTPPSPKLPKSPKPTKSLTTPSTVSRSSASVLDLPPLKKPTQILKPTQLLTPKRSPAKKPEKVAAKADTEDKKIAVKVKSQDDTKEKKKAEKPTPKAPTTPTLESTKRKRSPTPPPNPETAEQKKARKLKAAEGMVLDILGDAEFLELTELVGEVWQRMGLQNVGGIWSRDSS